MTPACKIDHVRNGAHRAFNKISYKFTITGIVLAGPGHKTKFTVIYRTEDRESVKGRIKKGNRIFVCCSTKHMARWIIRNQLIKVGGENKKTESQNKSPCQITDVFQSE